MRAFVLMLVLTWAAALGGWWMWNRARRASELERIRKRLASAAGPPPKAARPTPALIRREDRSAGQMVLSILQRLKLTARLKLLLEQAGLKWTVLRTAHGSLALLLAGFSLTWYGAPAYRPLAPVVALLLGAMPLLHVLRLRSARMRKFEAQFPESLEFLARSMRAGHAFSVSLEMIHSEFQEPLAGEFRRVFDEQNLGMPLETALQNLARRAPSMDVHFFVSAVLLQKRTGGNLAEVLEKLAHLIRERFKLRGRIRAISAHGRMTGMALSLIPVGVGVMMCFVNPDYAQFFANDETGNILLGGAIGLQLIGYGVMKKITSIEV